MQTLASVAGGRKPSQVESPRVDGPDDSPPFPSGDYGSGDPVGYDFDPLPSILRRNGLLLKLKPIDKEVLAILISFAVWRRDSCWVTIRTIAARLLALRAGRCHRYTISERTIQRSIGRLKSAGIISHRRVAKPDPDQPENFTGWRFYFLWPIEVRERTSPKREVTKPAREVTNGPGEVTNAYRPTLAAESTRPLGASIEAPPSPGFLCSEVTNKSGDILVTQDRGEVKKPERIPTLNVAALAGEEQMNTASTPSPVSAIWSAAELAAKFRAQMRNRDIILELIADSDGVEKIVARRLTHRTEPIQPEEIAELQRLRPHLLDLLRPKPAEAPAPRPAPPVPAHSRAEVMRRLVGLRLPETTNPEVASTARALLGALGPHADEGLTEARLIGLCGAARRGELPESILISAFEEACGPRKLNRGASFTAEVKRLLGLARSKDRKRTDGA